MTPSQAEALVAAVLAPLTLDGLKQGVAAHRPLYVSGGSEHPTRQALLGGDPRAAVLAAYATHAAKLDWHAVAPTDVPPSREGIAGASDFVRLIADFHARGYTVRVPDAETLTPEIAGLARALAATFSVPVGGSVFWSVDRARAKVHFDDNDILVVQLVGTKRWFVSSETPLLPNPWKDVLTPPTELGAHTTVDLVPGDLLYVPRGTAHTVESEGECLHVTLTFTPLTVRAALLAALDHASEQDRAFRATLLEPGAPLLGKALAALGQRLSEPGFLEAALERRVSRFMGELPELPKAASATAATRFRHTPLALLHLRTVGERLDLAMPGGHLNVHASAADALAFIAETPEFALADLPGVPIEIARALVEKLAAAGVLESA